MRAAIFDPYIDTIGGGERYVFTFAHSLLKNGWEVDVEWKDEKIIEQIDRRLNIGLDGIKVVENVHTGTGYDLIFWLSDGSIPALWSKNNILHIQTPFKNVGGKSLLNRLKMRKINKVICNSEFTKGFVDKEYGVNSYVVYPPVSINEFKESKKENRIIFVGRFSRLQQEKRQDVLIQTFKELCDAGLKGWKLTLIGGSDIGGTEYIGTLKELGLGYPIEIFENLPFQEVAKYYGKSKIFWSAVGFDVDEQKHPEKVEHFGISLVEAMSAGCVPIVLNKGGYREILDDSKDGYLWSSKEELKVATIRLIKDERRRKEIAENAKAKSVKFSQDRFEKQMLQLIS